MRIAQLSLVPLCELPLFTCPYLHLQTVEKRIWSKVDKKLLSLFGEFTASGGCGAGRCRQSNYCQWCCDTLKRCGRTWAVRRWMDGLDGGRAGEVREGGARLGPTKGDWLLNFEHDNLQWMGFGVHKEKEEVWLMLSIFAQDAKSCTLHYKQ